jgi:hypothetical protein
MFKRQICPINDSRIFRLLGYDNLNLQQTKRKTVFIFLLKNLGIQNKTFWQPRK